MIRTVSSINAIAMLSRSDNRLAEALLVVAPILADIRLNGDRAVRKYAQLFDDFRNDSFFTSTSGLLDENLASSVNEAIKNIRNFATQQISKTWTLDVDGRKLGQIIRPIESVGIYVPAGRYPLLSTMIMAVVPAQVAGVKYITVACPHPTQEMLALASLLGIQDILQLGGAQAIAAMAYGTESIKPVQRIVGPGNVYVAAAKKLVSADVAIDFVAGPSEIAIISASGNPVWIAADMLAQAEHDENARAILFTTSKKLAFEVSKEVEAQLEGLTTKSVASVAIEMNSAIVLCDSIEEAVSICNKIAPEHLAIDDESLIPLINNAGSLFIGQYSTEAVGDYASGPNHILPTSGMAAIRGGLSVNDFVKVITTQQVTLDGLRRIGPTVMSLARIEGLEAHARSVEVRLNV